MRKYGYKAMVLLLLAVLLTGCKNADIEVRPTEYESETITEVETEIETEIETETQVEPVVTTVTISATGDCALGPVQTHSYTGSFNDYYDSYGEEYFFQNFREIFQADDLTLINLECVLTNETNRVEKTFNIKGKPEYTGIMTSSSIEAVSLGNNHSADYGAQSLVDTKAALDAAGIKYAINDTISYYTTEEGIVVAMVSASITSWGNSRDQYLLDGVAEAKNKGADIVVACCHWGIEREHYPNSYQTNLGHALIDKGADLVIGNHPHVLQGIEEYNGKIIVYSLGNFSFGANKNPTDKDTAVYQQTFTFVDGVLQADISAKIIPSRLSSHDSYNDYCPVIAEADKARNIIKRMNEYSAPYSGVYFDEQGNLFITEE